MFRTKSFSLVKEDDKSQPKKNLYQPKRCPGIKFILIPALIGFMALLILSNVEFSKTKSESRIQGTDIKLLMKFKKIQNHIDVSGTTTSLYTESSDTSDNTTEISTTSETTTETTTTGTTTESYSTPETSETSPPITPPAHLTVYCSNCSWIDECRTSYTLPTVEFEILSETSTSIRIEVKLLKDSSIRRIRILYFQYPIDDFENTLFSLSKPIIIQNLETSSTYTFCLMETSRVEVSPFNCEAHHIENIDLPVHLTFYQRHKSLILIVGIFGLILFFLFGIFMMFSILRCQHKKGQRKTTKTFLYENPY